MPRDEEENRVYLGSDQSPTSLLDPETLDLVSDLIA